MPTTPGEAAQARIPIALLTVATATLIGSCASATTATAGGPERAAAVSVASSGAAKPEGVIRLSWAERVRSVKDIRDRGYVFAEGTFGAQADASSGSGADRIPAVRHQFVLERVVFAPAKATVKAGDTMQIVQTGGEGVVVEGDPLFVRGSRAVLVLRQAPTGTWMVVGGPSGRLNFVDGVASPFSSESLQVVGTLDELAAAVSG